MKYGLLGRTLGHSYSPAIHALLGDYEYSLVEKEPEELASFLKSGDFSGLNVTIPYKKAAIPYLDVLTETAKQLGAVNTIVRQPDGTLLGHNTDFFGFRSMLAHSGLDCTGKKCLVLGSGGASTTVQAVLSQLGAEVIVVSRSGANNYKNLYLHADAAILVNTTPVGMYPSTGLSPVDLSNFPKLEGVLDLIYNPAKTQLLLDAQHRGLVTENGLWMLVAQAKEAAEYFTNSSICDTKIEEIYRILRKTSENIILIGMPGCGKSSVAAELSRKIGRPLVDIDAEIEKSAGIPIPQIFAESGEDAFRHLETQVLARFCKESGLVISTGGGCVTRPENKALLHQNSVVYYLRRDLDTLATEGRPLFQKHSPAQLYAQRKTLYEEFSHITVDNNGTISETAAKIFSDWEETP